MGVYLVTPKKEKESDDGGLIELSGDSFKDQTNSISKHDPNCNDSSLFCNLNSTSHSVYTSSRYGVTEMQGWRHTMEDAHIAMPNATKYNLGVYGVFDGHGGNAVSAWIALHFIEIFENELDLFSSKVETENLRCCSSKAPLFLCSNDAAGSVVESLSCGMISSSFCSSSSSVSPSVINSSFSSYIPPSEEFLFCEALKSTFFKIDVLLQTEESRNELKVLHEKVSAKNNNNKDSSEVSSENSTSKNDTPAVQNWLQYFLSDPLNNKNSNVSIVEQDGQRYFQLSSDAEDEEDRSPEKEVIKSNLKIEVFDETSSSMDIDKAENNKEEDISMENKAVDAAEDVSLQEEEKAERAESEGKRTCNEFLVYDENSGQEDANSSSTLSSAKKKSEEAVETEKTKENIIESVFITTAFPSQKNIKAKNEQEKKEEIFSEEPEDSLSSSVSKFSTAEGYQKVINANEEKNSFCNASDIQERLLESPLRTEKVEKIENIVNNEVVKDLKKNKLLQLQVDAEDKKNSDSQELLNPISEGSCASQDAVKKEKKQEDLSIIPEDILFMNKKSTHAKDDQEEDILETTEAQNEKVYDEEEERVDLEDNYLENDPRTPESCGATAVVAVLVTHFETPILLVANAGDSRAVLCRNRKAVALSVDHKPNMPQENSRIYRAGGYVAAGRVDGNLNLSRSLGDLCYKQDKNLTQDQQKITALPDIRITPITHEDEFVVIACDGIWDCLTNQEVIDFVADRLYKSEDDKSSVKLSKICEELCDKCLSPSPFESDSIGCDNMTCMIVQFSNKVRKKMSEESKIFLYGIGEDESMKLFDNYLTNEERDENMKNIRIAAKRNNKNKCKKKFDIYNMEDSHKNDGSDEEVSYKSLDSEDFFLEDEAAYDYLVGGSDDSSKKKKKKEKKKKSKNFDSSDVFLKSSSKDDKTKKIETDENVEVSQDDDENRKRKLGGGKKRKEKNLNEIKKSTEKRKASHETVNINDIAPTESSNVSAANLIKHDLHEAENNSNGILA